MNDDELGVALKQAAHRWDPPAFDAAAIAVESNDRRHRARRAAFGALFAVLVIAGAVTALALRTGPGSAGLRAQASSPSRRTPAHGSPSRSLSDVGTAPAISPPVRIRALEDTGDRVGRARVLVRVPAGTPATVRARLGFYRDLPGRVRDTAIVVARPGTQPAAAPWGTGNYYRAARVAISTRVHATSPQFRILNVTTPPDLPPGVYPVLTVVHTVLLPGQPKSGLYGPFAGTSELGVIVITAP